MIHQIIAILVAVHLSPTQTYGGISVPLRSDICINFIKTYEAVFADNTLDITHGTEIDLDDANCTVSGDEYNAQFTAVCDVHGGILQLDFKSPKDAQLEGDIVMFSIDVQNYGMHDEFVNNTQFIMEFMDTNCIGDGTYPVHFSEFISVTADDVCMGNHGINNSEIFTETIYAQSGSTLVVVDAFDCHLMVDLTLSLNYETVANNEIVSFWEEYTYIFISIGSAFLLLSITIAGIIYKLKTRKVIQGPHGHYNDVIAFGPPPISLPVIEGPEPSIIESKHGFPIETRTPTVLEWKQIEARKRGSVDMDRGAPRTPVSNSSHGAFLNGGITESDNTSESNNDTPNDINVPVMDPNLTRITEPLDANTNELPPNFDFCSLLQID